MKAATCQAAAAVCIPKSIRSTAVLPITVLRADQARCQRGLSLAVVMHHVM